MSRPVRVVSISKEFRFEAAHELPNHDGKCRNLHGHSYVFSVQLSGPVNTTEGASSEGMVLDFGEVSKVWKALEPKLDHRYLNEVLPLEYLPSTAENIARYLVDYFRTCIESEDGDNDVFVDSVTVFETATSSATAR